MNWKRRIINRLNHIDLLDGRYKFTPEEWVSARFNGGSHPLYYKDWASGFLAPKWRYYVYYPVWRFVPRRFLSDWFFHNMLNVSLFTRLKRD